jgi:hypothetical protein
MKECPKCGYCEDKEEKEDMELDEGLEVSAKDDILSELMESLAENLGKKIKKD